MVQRTFGTFAFITAVLASIVLWLRSGRRNPVPITALRLHDAGTPAGSSSPRVPTSGPVYLWDAPAASGAASPLRHATSGSWQCQPPPPASAALLAMSMPGVSGARLSAAARLDLVYRCASNQEVDRATLLLQSFNFDLQSLMDEELRQASPRRPRGLDGW